MLNPLKFFSKPEYFLRPSQTLTRFAHLGRPMPESATVRLPWGTEVTVHTNENVGCEIYHHGIFDKIVPEAIWRLLDPGETALEIGANIGQNALAMAARAGINGRVLAFEPHPQIFEELESNCRENDGGKLAFIQLEKTALGPQNGEATLHVTEEFATNRGSATLKSGSTPESGIKVQVRRLDDFLEKIQHVGVCKIDVEGYELAVLQGAEKTLARHGIRDIVFEDFNPQPSPVTELLQAQGFTLFELHDTWLKPRLIRLDASKTTAQPGFSFNYLATLDPERARLRFQKKGWRCLLNR